MNIEHILQQTIDFHVHVGPEIIPRTYTVSELIAAEQGKLKGVAIKNHFFPTIAMNTKETLAAVDPFIIPSVTLNHYVGGFNPDIIRATAELSPRPIVVWFPTIHTANYLEGKEFEVAEEWINPLLRSTVRLRPASEIEPLSILDENKQIRADVRTVITTIQQYNAILATGHLPWEETQQLVKYAMQQVGLKKVIITHPIYNKISMPIEVQKELAELGATIEHAYSMFSIDKIPMTLIAEQIKDIGPQYCVLTSDVGQTFSPSPSQALKIFITQLMTEGVTEDDIFKMCVVNTNAFLS